MTMSTTNFSNQLLVAMPSLTDANFARTVTLICEHNAQGALGIVINRPSELTAKDLLDHLEIETHLTALACWPIYAGGPVQMEHGFVLHTPLGHWESTLKINDEMGLTTSRDILSTLATGTGPEKALIAMGYAGWGAGQLEQEIVENAWLTVPYDRAIVFSLPTERRWAAAAAKLGVDLNLLSGHAGHA